MNNLYDVLEICLQELENGADLEAVLTRYPDLAGELRPILKASIMARTMAAPAPSADAVRRGRAKLLQHAAQLRETKAAPTRRMIPFFQRLAISFALTALLLSSGTGLVSASSSALPGENLYPVKLTWENLRLFFSFSNEAHEALEHAFENERLHEVNELLVEGRHETIRFAGVYMEVSGVTYVSGIHVVILDTSVLPVEPLLNGVAVEVTGRTNAQGFVDVETIQLLPAGSVVPVGSPVEVEEDHSDNENGGNNTNASRDDEKRDNDYDEKDNSNINSNADSNEDDSDGSNSNEDTVDEGSDTGNEDNRSIDDNNNDSNNNDSSDDKDNNEGSSDDSSDDSNDD